MLKQKAEHVKELPESRMQRKWLKIIGISTTKTARKRYPVHRAINHKILLITRQLGSVLGEKWARSFGLVFLGFALVNSYHRLNTNTWLESNMFSFIERRHFKFDIFTNGEIASWDRHGSLYFKLCTTPFHFTHCDTFSSHDLWLRSNLTNLSDELRRRNLITLELSISLCIIVYWFI